MVYVPPGQTLCAAAKEFTYFKRTRHRCSEKETRRPKRPNWEEDADDRPCFLCRDCHCPSGSSRVTHIRYISNKRYQLIPYSRTAGAKEVEPHSRLINKACALMHCTYVELTGRPSLFRTCCLRLGTGGEALGPLSCSTRLRDARANMDAAGARRPKSHARPANAER